MLFIPQILWAQVKIEKIFLDKNSEKCDSIVAKFTDVYLYSDTVLKSGIKKRFNSEGVLLSEKSYADFEKETLHGLCKEYYKNGNVMFIATYNNNEPEGELKTFYEQGQKKRLEVYQQGKMKSGNCYTITGRDTAFFEYSIMPSYDGGEEAFFKFLSKNIKYPRKARRSGISGTVYIGFIVDKEGMVKDVFVKKALDPLLDKEAMRVISLLKKWNPGFKDGVPTAVSYTLPIKFKLQ